MVFSTYQYKFLVVVLIDMYEKDNYPVPSKGHSGLTNRAQKAAQQLCRPYKIPLLYPMSETSNTTDFSFPFANWLWLGGAQFNEC